MKSLLVFLGVFIVIILIGVGGQFLDFWSFSYFAPKVAGVENKVFHESAQYNDGMIRDLENLQMQYRTADDVGKASLKATVLHRFSVYPEDRLPADLRNFYTSLRGY